MIGLLQKFTHILPQHSLLTLYKTFIGPHFDYEDVASDKVFNESFHKNLKLFNTMLR